MCEIAASSVLPVMYGCNNFCSYCIVPYVRGRERSRMVEAVLEEARSLVEAGYRDITLLGQNVNSYGKDLETPVPFAQLLREINAIPGDFRIRFMTSHPKDCTRELLDAMADCEKVAKHLHLPFQSGNDRVLKEMNRRYTREQYLELIRYARQVMPELSLTSDVIVGFPGETYEAFQDTLSLVEEVGFTSLFTFIFSPREGTPAAKMPDPVSREEKGRWFRELTDLQERVASARNQKLLGKRFRVLVEGPGKKAGLLPGAQRQPRDRISRRRFTDWRVCGGCGNRGARVDITRPNGNMTKSYFHCENRLQLNACILQACGLVEPLME